MSLPREAAEAEAAQITGNFGCLALDTGGGAIHDWESADGPILEVMGGHVPSSSLTCRRCKVRVVAVEGKPIDWEAPKEQEE